MRKLLYEFVRKSFEKENYKLLSKKYINSQTPLKFKCPRGHMHAIKWAYWNGGERCIYCYKEDARKYTLNEKYFDNIDTEPKAYFLGLLYADGCNDGATIKLQLAEKDRDILEKLKIEIGSNTPLQNQKPRLIKFKKDSRSYMQKKSYILKLNSRYLCRRLSEIGCIPKKTFLLEFPLKKHLPINLTRHFIRGYFDGDGSLHIPKHKKGCGFTFIGRENFCLKVKQVLENTLNIRLTFNKYKKHSFWTIQSGSIPNIKKILDFFYADATIYLNRKHEKYIDFINFKYKPFINNNRFANNIYKENMHAE